MVSVHGCALSLGAGPDPREHQGRSGAGETTLVAGLLGIRPMAILKR